MTASLEKPSKEKNNLVNNIKSLLKEEKDQDGLKREHRFLLLEYKRKLEMCKDLEDYINVKDDSALRSPRNVSLFQLALDLLDDHHKQKIEAILAALDDFDPDSEE